MQHDARFKQFTINLRSIVGFNLKHPNATWWAAPNKFTDLSWAEFSGFYLGLDASKARHPQQQAATKGGPRRALLATPSVVDWQAAGLVTPIKDQVPLPALSTLPCGPCCADCQVCQVCPAGPTHALTLCPPDLPPALRLGILWSLLGLRRCGCTGGAVHDGGHESESVGAGADRL